MPVEGYVLAHDVGTTSIKVGLVQLRNLRVVEKASKPAEIIYPKKGWAELDPSKLLEDIASLSREVLERNPEYPKMVKGLIFSPHMAGVAPVDEDGNPLRNPIIWLDERAAGFPKSLWRGLIRIQGYNLFKLLKFLRITGGAPSKTGKDPISKILWIKHYEPEVYRKTYKFLDIKGLLISAYTGSQVTSHDEANLTWLVDTRRGKAEWWTPLFREYELPVEKFPEIRDSIDIAGRLKPQIAREIGVEAGIPVFVGAGDLTTAAVGSGAVREGEVHIYVGTSNWIGAHLSRRIVDVSHYIGSILSAIPGRYLLVAEQEVAAGALEWAMKIAGLEGRYDEVEELVRSAGTYPGKILFLPWMYGERCPIDDPYVRGGILNLSLEDGVGEILKAIMEGVSFNIKWAYTYVEKIIGYREKVNLVGGATLFDTWCQILADVLGRRLERVVEPQNVTLVGASIIASVGLGAYESFEEACKNIAVDRVFKPGKNASKNYEESYREFVKTYDRLRDVFKRLNYTKV